MAESDRAMVRIALLNQNVTVKSSHLGDCKNAYSAERARSYGENLALGNIRAELALAVALQAVERDIRSCDIALQRAAREIGLRVLRFKQSVLNELILDSTVLAELAGRRVSAVKSHKCVGERVRILALDILFVQIRGNGVVDVEQRHRVACDAHSYVLAQRAVDVNLAGNRYSARNQTRVHIARLKAECFGERRPAFVRKSNVFARALVLFSPVKKREFKLRHTLVHLGIISSLAHFLCHFLADIGNSRVTRVRLVRHQQIQLRVFLNLNAELVQTFNRRVAREKVLRARAEGDNLQSGKSDERSRNRDKLAYHFCNIFGCSDRVGRDIRFQVAHTEIVRAVQHTAVSVAASADKVVARLLGCRRVHHRSVKILCNKRFGSLGTKVPQEHNQRVAARCFRLIDSLEHIDFVFNRGLALVNVNSDVLASCRDSRSALF